MTTRSGSLPPPRPGEVIRYAYLWRREHEMGRQDGAKDRPAGVVLTMLDAEGRAHVYVVPVTSRPPSDPSYGVAVPPDVRRRLGLQDEPCWIIVTELNRFVWPGPDLVRMSPPRAGYSYGLLPRKLFLAVRDAALAHARATQGVVVRRSE